MTNDLFFSTRQVVKYWWASLLIGILAIVLSIWCAASPASTLLTLSIIFVINLVITGVFEIIFAISNRNTLNGWGWSLASGIIDLLFGLLLMMMPLASIFVLIFFIGFWILLQSAWGIGSAFELKRHKVGGWGWVLFFSLLGLLLAFTLITNPAFASNFLVILFAISLALYGIQKVYYAFRLRALHKLFNEE